MGILRTDDEGTNNSDLSIVKIENSDIIYSNLLWVIVLEKRMFTAEVTIMIKRKSEMTEQTKVAMRGGDGQAIVTQILDKGEYKGNARLVGVITLEKDCSIGAHVHEGEEEIFYVIDGTATYYDNGETVILNKGDSCICLGGQEHSIANRHGEALRVFAVILTY